VSKSGHEQNSKTTVLTSRRDSGQVGFLRS
jgi:hypothetical protein